MATGVGLRQISLTQLNSPSPQPPHWCNNGGRIFYTSRVIGNFVFNNSGWLQWQQGWSGVSLNDTIKLAVPENPHFGANSLYVSSTCQSYSSSE